MRLVLQILLGVPLDIVVEEMQPYVHSDACAADLCWQEARPELLGPNVPRTKMQKKAALAGASNASMQSPLPLCNPAMSFIDNGMLECLYH